jgi:glycosyltransferase involved in cell wall biosynthesis
MSNPLISFAIPIYNFGRFIGHTVDSIVTGSEVLRQEDFEILVLDGGSTDDTPTVMSSLMAQYKNLRYLRIESRGGIDHDLNLAISLTSGRYVWLFSGDDVLCSGWDLYVKPLLIDIDIALIPAILCDINMIKRRSNPIFNIPHGSHAVTFPVHKDDGTLERYLSLATSLESLFGFMSSVIVRSDFWHTLPDRKDYYGTCWAHCARLIQGFRAGCSITYLPKFLVHKRGGNDSFMENGLVARIGLSIYGWQRIIEEFFNDQVNQATLYELLRHDISISIFLYGKVSAKTNIESIQLEDMARMLYKEKYPTSKSMIQYGLFQISPLKPSLALIIEPTLPHLIKFRHWVKRYFP